MKRKIILIVGSSGVGKDTLLKESKKLLSKDYNFVRRHITRKPCKNEDNFFLENGEFETLIKSNFFISSWQAHGNTYGIAKKSIDNSINIISISRSKIKEFEDNFQDVTTINIFVNKEKLRERLENRSRENKEEIEKRLNRSYGKIEARNLIEFDNSENIEKSSRKFIELLKSL